MTGPRDVGEDVGVASADMTRLAVLIDADNATASLATELLAEIAKYGTPTIKEVPGPTGLVKAPTNSIGPLAASAVTPPALGQGAVFAGLEQSAALAPRAKQQASALVLRQPDAAEAKGLGEKVEVAVDVQDVCTVLLGARADDQVRQRDAMLPARGQLTLGGFGA